MSTFEAVGGSLYGSGWWVSEDPLAKGGELDIWRGLSVFVSIVFVRSRAGSGGRLSSYALFQEAQGFSGETPRSPRPFSSRPEGSGAYSLQDTADDSMGKPPQLVSQGPRSLTDWLFKL